MEQSSELGQGSLKAHEDLSSLPGLAPFSSVPPPLLFALHNSFPLFFFLVDVPSLSSRAVGKKPSLFPFVGGQTPQYFPTVSLLCVSFSAGSGHLVSDTAGDPMCGLPHTKPFPVTPAGCPTVELNADTIYQEIVLDPTGQGLSQARPPPPAHIPQMPVESSHCHWCF